jgi:ankyrin repeat protein
LIGLFLGQPSFDDTLRSSELLFTKADNQPDAAALFVFQTACQHNCVTVVDAFLQHGFDVNTVLPCGRTGLVLSVMFGGSKLTELFLKNGADVSVTSETSLFMSACGSGWDMFCRFKDHPKLLANLNCTDEEGRSMLLLALRNYHIEVAAYLLGQKDIDVDLVDVTGKTVLHYAVKTNDLEITNTLLRQFIVSPNCADENGFTPLHQAAWDGKLKMTELLIEAGAEVNFLDKKGESALHYTLRNSTSGDSTIKIFQYLLEHGADPEIRYNDCPLLWYLVESVGLHRESRIRLILQNGGIVDFVRGPKNLTPLMRACEMCDKPIAILLVEYGADLYARNKENQTVFDILEGAYGSNVIDSYYKRKAGTIVDFKKALEDMWNQISTTCVLK